MTLKIIFAGTPEFAVPTLQALIDSPHEVVAVYTQPDRPKGRGRKLQMSAVKQLAIEHDLRVLQPASLRDVEAQEQLELFDADLMVVAAYGLLLPKVVLALPRLGCVNVHASLLPRWRGAAPIAYAILRGDGKTGVTIMQMVSALDAGDMLARVETEIQPHDNAAELLQRLSLLGAEALLKVIPALEKGEVNAEPQDESLVTYASKIHKVDAKIDWQQTAIEIDRMVRAYYGWPVAFTDFNGEVLRIWQAECLVEKIAAEPGTLLLRDKKHLDVVCGDGMLRLLQLQLPGKKQQSVQQFIQAHQGGLSEQLLG